MEEDGGNTDTGCREGGDSSTDSEDGELRPPPNIRSKGGPVRSRVERL